MTPVFWPGKRVLVTGHTGFKGTWLCWWLKQLGANVTGFALEPPTSPSLFESSGLAGEMADEQSDIRGDVRDPSAIQAVFDGRRPEIVFHLAAQSLVRESYRSPVDTFVTNLMGTVHCLQAARHARGLLALLVVTSDKCYRNTRSQRQFHEDDALGGDDPYSASKACAEIATYAWRRSFFLTQGDAAQVATVRAGNVIGGGDWAVDRLIPDAIRAFTVGSTLRIRNPGATRPWQHVLEPLRGYLMLAERLCARNPAVASEWNFGPDSAGVRPVSWVADGLALRWGRGARWQADSGDHPHEASALALDAERARRVLGWRPTLALDQALDWVIEWYRAAATGGDLRAVTGNQIARYQALCVA